MTKESLKNKKNMPRSKSRKTAIYLSNFIAGIKPVREIAGKGIEKILGSSAGYEIGNPVGAILYGGIELAKQHNPDIKKNKYIRLTEAAGAVYYGLSTISDLFGILNGDLGYIAKFPFDLGMLYETATNASKDYKETGTSIKKDIIDVKNDFYSAIDETKEFFMGKKPSKKKN